MMYKFAPLLKQGDYEMWRLRIEQYFQIQDYALWDIIENGNSFNPVARTTTNADSTSTSTIPCPVTTEEKAQKKNDVKSNTNEVNTANVQVSTANSSVSTDSTLDSTANLSDATVYAFLANQPNESQLQVKCRCPRNQESRARNQDSSRRTVNVEETASKAMVAIDGASFMELQLQMMKYLYHLALMASLNSEEFQQPEFKGYGFKDNKSVCENSSNEIKKTNDAGKIKIGYSDCNEDDYEVMGEGPTHTVESQHTPIASPPTSQPTTSQPMSSQEQPSQVPILNYHTDFLSPHHIHSTPTPGIMIHLSQKAGDILSRLKKGFMVIGSYKSWLKKVKHWKAKLKSTTERRKARMVIYDDKEDLVLEDTSKQGRMTETEYEEVEIDLNQTNNDLQRLTPTKVTQGEEQCQESSEAQLSVLSAAKILADASQEKNTDEKVAQKLNDEEMTREEQERIDFEKALELQNQLDEREETDNIDWNTVDEQVRKTELDTRWVYFKGMSLKVRTHRLKKSIIRLLNLFKNDTEVIKTKRICRRDTTSREFQEVTGTAEASKSENLFKNNPTLKN
ncbi:hypothetical protein Tco_0078248 [Tanacetum coccineum]